MLMIRELRRTLFRLLAQVVRTRRSRYTARLLGIALISYPVLMTALVMLRRKLRHGRVAVHYGPHTSNLCVAPLNGEHVTSRCRLIACICHSRKVQMLKALRTYAPTWWLLNGHLQTVFAVVGRRMPTGIEFRVR